MIRTGVDIIENARVARALDRFGARFLNRIFTPSEQEQASGRIQALAARFAAKEAVSKMLGTGIGPVRWLDMEILDGFMGAPRLVLHGSAKRWARWAGLREWSVSMSHIKSHSVAMATGWGHSLEERDMDVSIGATQEKTITVTPEKTAQHVGSGDLSVFATPEMVWLLESTCSALIAPHLDPGESSVGVRVDVRHLAPTPVGMQVTATATLTDISGNLMHFHIVLHDEQERIGEADHVRAVIAVDRFLDRVAAKKAS